MKGNVRSYQLPWEGQLILACRKCQKKMKGNSDLRPLARLKKTIRRYNKEHPDGKLHVINVPCMDLCPKDGVTICNPVCHGLMILRNAEDIARLHSP